METDNLFGGNMTRNDLLKPLTWMLSILLGALAPLAFAATDAEKPNILVIWGDDVGMWNISAYHRGMMGGSTPNIDRIADEGMIFMDHYAQASCTAGRAAFLLGQYPMRTGLSTVGLPGAKEGLQDSNPTLASMLKAIQQASLVKTTWVTVTSTCQPCMALMSFTASSTT